jgi:zinc transport system substrate-binding protein
LKAIADLIHMIQEKHLKSIYSEALVSQKFVQTIQKETDVNIYTLNALETLTPEQIQAKENYFTIMEKNLEALKTGLECE